MSSRVAKTTRDLTIEVCDTLIESCEPTSLWEVPHSVRDDIGEKRRFHGPVKTHIIRLAKTTRDLAIEVCDTLIESREPTSLCEVPHSVRDDNRFYED